MFISLQAGQNFPPAGQISLQCGMVSLMYFFIFSLQITKFPGKELHVLPVFSTPLQTTPPAVHGDNNVLTGIPFCLSVGECNEEMWLR